MIPGPPIKPNLLNKKNSRINPRSKYTSSQSDTASVQQVVNRKLSIPRKFSPEDRSGSSQSSIDSAKLSLSSKYSILPEIKSFSKDGDTISKEKEINNNLMNVSREISEISISDPELVLAIRFPSGRKIVNEVKDHSKTLKELITTLGIENKERLDIDYLQCLNAAVSGGPKIYTDEQMKQPIRNLKIQNKSLLIFQYSD